MKNIDKMHRICIMNERKDFSKVYRICMLILQTKNENFVLDYKKSREKFVM